MMADLVKTQNDLIRPIDILSITGFMNDAALEKHLEYYQDAVRRGK